MNDEKEVVNAASDHVVGLKWGLLSQLILEASHDAIELGALVAEMSQKWVFVYRCEGELRAEGFVDYDSCANRVADLHAQSGCEMVCVLKDGVVRKRARVIVKARL